MGANMAALLHFYIVTSLPSQVFPCSTTGYFSLCHYYSLVSVTNKKCLEFIYLRSPKLIPNPSNSTEHAKNEYGTVTQRYSVKNSDKYLNMASTCCLVKILVIVNSKTVLGMYLFNSFVAQFSQHGYTILRQGIPDISSLYVTYFWLDNVHKCLTMTLKCL